jgi:nucleoside-diphosphate-sugar epimerase
MAVLGRGLNRLPLIYVRDAARGVLLAAEAAQAGRAYVLVNPEPVPQRAYLDTIAAELGVPAPTKRVSYRLALTAAGRIEALTRLGLLRAPPPVMRFGIQLLGGENRFSIDRAHRELGFTPCVSMSDGVARSVRWYRQARAEPRALVAA